MITLRFIMLASVGKLLYTYDNETKEMMMLLLAIAIWWTIAVVGLILMILDSDRDIANRALIVGLAVFWPICAIVALPVLIYQGMVASTNRIRADREFEQWLKDRDAATILAKEQE